MPSAPYIGFEVQLAGGGVVRESDCYWDAVPDGVARLALRTGEGKELVALDAAPGRRFFFCNEGVALKGCYGILAAKVIGYVEGDTVVEARLDLLEAGSRCEMSETPRLSHRIYPLSQFELHPAALRTGA